MTLFCRIVRNLQRGRSFAKSRLCMEDAAAELSARLTAEGTFFAFQEPEWQEGPEGASHCAASDKLRQALLTLRGLDLPDAGELG